MKKTVLLIICSLVSLALLAGGAWGDVFCVWDAAGLQDALDDAATNGEDDTIRVVQGTYNGNFVYNNSDNHGIALLGGYIGLCLSRELDPANTILDGGGTGRVLHLNLGTNATSVRVEGFTIQNGNDVYGGVYVRSTGGLGDITLSHNIITDNIDVGVYAYTSTSTLSAKDIIIEGNIITGNNSAGSGAGVDARSESFSGTTGDIILTDNIITDNSADDYGGGVTARTYSSGIGTAGDITLVNNIIAGNTAGDNGGGVQVSSSSSLGTAGDVILTNNTITGNRADDNGGGLNITMYNNTNEVTNNIIWGNTASTGDGDDICLAGTGTAQGSFNDYTNMEGSWTDALLNIDENPEFVDPGYWDDNGTPLDPSDDFWVDGNYHLLPSSPCIDQGINFASEIPDYDFEGDDRIIDGDKDGTAHVDMGADEYVLLTYVILHKDGALWSSDTGWAMGSPPYYAGSDYARDLEYLDDGDYLILHKDGAIYDSGVGWTLSSPPYYAGSNYAVDLEVTVSDADCILDRDGALWYSDTGWVLSCPPYYAGSDYARALEVRADDSYVILHKYGAIYDSASGWIMTSPPFYPGSAWVVDMKLQAGGYVLLHKDGGLWSTSGGWVTTSPPYYAGSDYARALELVGSRYIILHKDGAIYDSVDGWNMDSPPYYAGSNYAVDLEVW